jgi:hypothetical protein
VSGDATAAARFIGRALSLSEALKLASIVDEVCITGKLFLATLPFAALAGEPGQDFIAKRFGAFFEAIDRAYAAGYVDEGRDLWVLGGIS